MPLHQVTTENTSDSFRCGDGAQATGCVADPANQRPEGNPMLQRDDAASAPPFDPARRYVRLTQVRADGFVEFEFAIIGDPDLAVDLILPADAYRDFCRDNHAVLISALQGTAIDRARLRWSTNDRSDPG